MELYYDSNGHYPQDQSPDIGYYVSTLSTFLVPTDIASIPATLISDGDQYAWDSTYGYGLWIVLNSGTWCRTGQNVNPGWWGSPPVCNF